MQSGLQRIELLYGRKPESATFSSRSLTHLRLKAVEKGKERKFCLLSSQTQDLINLTPSKLRAEGTSSKRILACSQRANRIGCFESKLTSNESKVQEEYEEIVRKLEAGHGEDDDVADLFVEILLAALTHSRKANHKLYLQDMETQLNKFDKSYDDRLTREIHRAVQYELSTWFRATSRPSHYCVL